MGDRANIAILQPAQEGHAPEFVVLYGHSSGYQMPEVLRKAIARGARLDDEQYFARIVFDVLTDGAHGDVTGFGITTQVWDNGHPIIVADCGNAVVYTTDEKDLNTPTSQKIRFADYGALETATWNTFN
jgi:hypothetical protein